MNDRGINRLTTTDADGRYELRDMPAGTYRLTVSKSGFVTISFGQRRPSEEARTIELAEGQRVAANLTLPRGGAIVGRILDDAGEAVADVRVQALRSRMVEGQRRLYPVGFIDTTDDLGAYRVFGLEPGEYYVTAMVRSPAPEDARMSPVTGPLRGDIRSTVPVFFPGVSSMEQAQPVALAVGAEARADIFLAPLRMAQVSGVVLESSGLPAPDALVELRSDVLNMGYSAAYAGPPPVSISAHSAPDGTFELPNVPPGSYRIVATVQSAAARGAAAAFQSAVEGVLKGGTPPSPAEREKVLQLTRPEVVSMPIVIADANLPGLTLTTSPPGILTLTLVADAGVTRPLPAVGAQIVSGASSAAIDSMTTSANGSRQIRLTGASGPTRVRVTNLPDEWAVKAILIDGADVTDAPINFRGSVEGRLVLTDRITEVNGTVNPANAGGREVERQAHVVIFSADSSKWTYPSRFIRWSRSDEQGSFSVKGLPGNERYLAVAVNYLEDREAEDPQFLERMRGRASAISLNEGERKTIDVPLIQR
jgi:hypothetical protein